MKLTPLTDTVKIPQAPWVLPGWIRERTLTMISAPGGVGKSAFGTALGLALAEGKGFLGSPAPARAGRVVHIAIDAPKWDHAHVARRLVRGMGLDLSEPDEWSGGYWFCFEPFFLEDLTHDGRSTFEAMMNEAAYPSGAIADMVIIDSFRNIHDEDENDAKAMSKIMRFLRRWSERNCAIILLHHSKKPSKFTQASGWDSARGSGVIHNSVDTHIVLRALPQRKEGARIKFLAPHWEKGRGGDITPKFKCRLTWGDEYMRLTRVQRGRPKKLPLETNFSLPQKGH